MTFALALLLTLAASLALTGLSSPVRARVKVYHD